MKRPNCVRDEHLDFLDDLRKSGETIRIVGICLQKEYSLDEDEAGEIMIYWIKTRNKQEVV